MTSVFFKILTAVLNHMDNTTIEGIRNDQVVPS